METFWLVSQEARVKLMLYQAAHHKDKPDLDMADQKAPWQRESPRPEIAENVIDEDLEEIDRIMRQAPNPKRKVNL